MRQGLKDVQVIDSGHIGRFESDVAHAPLPTGNGHSSSSLHGVGAARFCGRPSVEGSTVLIRALKFFNAAHSSECIFMRAQYQLFDVFNRRRILACDLLQDTVSALKTDPSHF